MARVSIPTNDEVSKDLRVFFQNMENSKLQVLNIFRVMGHSPQIGMACVKSVMTINSSGKLRPRFRELAILRVGILAQASYE
jgi:alkylhydroperoxidase family enzyme